MFDLAASEQTFSLFTYWLGMAAVAAMASAAVFEAGNKQYDLFGIVVVSLAASLGGGSLRDMLLDRPVFWIADQTYLLIAMLAAFSVFVLVRWWAMPMRLFLVLDAIGLALFSISGTEAALQLNASPLVASFMGVTTGVMGGILRDVLCNEEPMVFKGPLNATPSWLGSWLYIGLVELQVSMILASLVAGGIIFLARGYAIWKGINLPTFRTKKIIDPDDV
ncbi:MAG: putative membrane protein YeiH [Oleispira sp.]|jgi:uncharacterized membrane protein YeiH